MTPSPDTKGAQPEQLVERLKTKYPDDALERLVRSDRASSTTHGDYLPELASLLLAERQEAATALSECREREEKLQQYLLNCDRYGGFPSTVTIRKMFAAQPPSEASERSG